MKRIIILALFVGLLTACHDRSSDPSLKKEKIIVVKIQNPTRRLYYTGVLAPLRMQSVLSPVMGRVVKMQFSYGQFVKKDQPLLEIDSLDLTQKYRKSIADYLQKKSVYTNSLEEFRGTKALYKAGVISREEFINGRSQYRTNELNYYQSRYAMEKILLKANVDPKKIEHLTIDDTDEVNQLLQRQFKNIVVRSTANGIVLFPIRGSGASDNKRLTLGTSVKQGQRLLTVGDLNGLSTHIHVNEVNIDRIHRGMFAVVTMSALPNLKLKALVGAVSSQAKSSDPGGTLSEFPVSIKIPKITAEQRKMIRVGMTAKVMIVIHQQPTILLPIKAIIEKNGQPMVTLVNRFGHRKNVSVVVGFTTPTEASIISGIKAGDRVVVAYD